MKKLLSIFLLLAMLVPALAHAAGSEPNRMLVVRPGGAFKAYDVERVSEINFVTMEGRVGCDIDYLECTEKTVTFDLYKDEGCSYYLINVMPAPIVRQLEANPAGAEEYMTMYGSPQDDREGENFMLQGLELKGGGDYAIVALSFDKYDCAGEVSAAYFSVPAAPLVGNPTVTAKMTSNSKTSITASFTANADVKGFAAVLSEKGQLTEQYDMFASMMGFACMGDMIKSWGVTYPGNSTQSYTWDELNPNGEYEIFYVAWDANDTFAQYQVLNVETEKQGGAGESVVTITPMMYRNEQWGDEMLPSQFFKFSPNDQTSCYRFRVDYADEYDAQKDAILADLKSDPEMPMAYWFFYDDMTTDYQINPNTTVVVTAAGKNINGEWGRVTELRYTTPAQVSGMPAKIIGKTMSVSPRVSPAPASAAGKARKAAPRLVIGK